ncbi:MAG: arylamine N-acetyltransferase family protein [Streptosporangiales bacterium]
MTVELDDVQAKLVGAGRGGYCYEHGVLFAAVLERLGYSVDRLLARIGANQDRPRPQSHMTLHVRAEGREWLADPGFGAGLLEPLPWEDAGPQRQGGWTYQLVPRGECGWQVIERHGHVHTPLYTFLVEPRQYSDVVVANYFTSTHPSSPFVGQVVIMRKDDASQLRLHGRRLTQLRPDGSASEHELDDGEIATAVRDEFGLVLGRQEITELLRCLPALTVT